MGFGSFIVLFVTLSTCGVLAHGAKENSVIAPTQPVLDSARALMNYYDGSLWDTVGWWNSANAFTAILQYMRLTGSEEYLYAIETTFENNLGEWDGNFTSDALDDTEWWALAWVEAYDLTQDQKYLNMAKLDADYIYQYHDNVCGGGVWWNIYKTYKNAITNSLYILLAASLHNRIPGDTMYLEQAVGLWNWFENSGMINEENLVNDGLLSDCTNNRATTWTYNQGVPIGALVELWKATGDQLYLEKAMRIADAVMADPVLTQEEILTEPCERSGETGCGDHTGGCDCNQISFKGIYMRHLSELNRNLENKPYSEYIRAQAESIHLMNTNDENRHGIHYAGPLEDVNAGTQQSSFEALLANATAATS